MGKTLKKYLLFDLDTTALKEEFGPKRYTVAYSMIRQFLENCGFEHKQGSGYLSTESISLNQTIAIYQAMTEEMPWLDSCSKTMDVGNVRGFYNLKTLSQNLVADKIAHYEKTGEMLKVTPARYKREFPWLKEVDSFALCNAQLNLDAAYRNFFRRVKAGEKHGFPKYKAKHRSRCCYKTNFVNGNIRFEGDERYLRLPKLGSVRVRQKREIDPSWRIKSVTVEHTRSGRFEVSVLFEFETQEPEQVKPESFVGLDYSSHDLYVTSDGERPGYPRYFRHAERKLAREQRKLSRMQKGSANWRKQKLRVARVHEKMKNQRKDFHHKAANGLVERYDCVCVENLDMRGMSRSLKLGKSTMDNGFGMFRALLGYKLEDRGKRLVTVGRLFPSSQLCHECGYRFSGTKDLSVREWTCPLCGRTHDRDVNAARNIRDEGMRLALSA